MFLYDLVSSKIIVIGTIIFTIKRGESHILWITNKLKLLVLSHVILVYTRNSVYIFQILGGKYINDIFSDVLLVPWYTSSLYDTTFVITSFCLLCNIVKYPKSIQIVVVLFIIEQIIIKFKKRYPMK